MLNLFLENSNDFSPKIIIGRNGSGKSFRLRKIHNDNTKNTLMITEDGHLISNKARKKVYFDEDFVHYIIPSDDKDRGRKDSLAVDMPVRIKDNLIDLVKFCNFQKEKVDRIIYKSKGQEKMSNILNILLNTFLNPIGCVLFDEPENYLDDDYLNLISLLMNKIAEAKIKVIVATHSPRLCELCNVELKDILVIDRYFSQDGEINYAEKRLSYEEILVEAKRITNEIELDRRKNGYDMDGGIDKKMNLCLNSEIFYSYLTFVLKSEEFYRSLFYANVFLVEGITEKFIVKEVRREIKENVYFFCADGKPFIPIFAWIFSQLMKNVYIVIDSDRKTKGKSTSYPVQVSITRYLEDNYKNVTVFEADLEEHFGIDVESFAKENRLENKWSMTKPLASKTFFGDDEQRKKFINLLNVNG